MVLQYPLSPNPPAAKFVSQGDAHVRTDAQIKFLHPLQRCYFSNFDQKLKLKSLSFFHVINYYQKISTILITS